MAYTIDFHWSGKKEFTNGWQLLWYGKFNQDEAIKERNSYYKALIKALKPKMIAEGLKPNKSNVFHYWNTPEYKEYMEKINMVNDYLGADNEETKKYIAILKERNEYYVK